MTPNGRRAVARRARGSRSGRARTGLRGGSDRPVAGQRDPPHRAHLGVVAVGVVRRAAVVPDADVAGLPAVPDRVLGLGEVCEEEVEDPPALRVGDADHVGGEARVDEQPLAPGLGVHADHRVLDRGQLRHLLAVPDVAAVAVAAQVGAPLPVAVVHRGELVDQPLHRRGQRLVGELAVDPARVAAVRREPDGAQDRSERRLLHERDVGVPDVGEGELGVGAVDVVDLRVLDGDAGRDRVPGGRLAQAAAEFDLVGVGEVLAAEEQHLVGDERLPDRGDLLVVEHPQVEADHLGAERGSEPVEREHGGAGRCLGHRGLRGAGKKRY